MAFHLSVDLPRLRRAYTQHDFAQHKGATHA
jgi:hypothetical protein